MSMPAAKIRVLVVDDSAIVRRILAESLAAEQDLEVVGTAPDPYVARDKILALYPDVVTLDIEMPRMDGLTFLKKLMHFHPVPVIIISSLGQASCRMAVEALRLGAVEVLAKPSGPYSVGELRQDLPVKIRAAAKARLRLSSAAAPSPPVPAPPAAADAAGSRVVIALGASTGGTEAIQTVLTGLPERCPPIVITQHIPAVFSRAFADRLDQTCRLRVKEAADGDPLSPGLALVAPGDLHMLLRRSGAGWRVTLRGGPKVNYQRPAVDVLFASVAESCGRDSVGVLMTGMGSDGAQGLLNMKEAGAYTICQDEATSVVFGMPQQGIRLGAALKVLPLHEIGPAMLAAAWRCTATAR